MHGDRKQVCATDYRQEFRGRSSAQPVYVWAPRQGFIKGDDFADAIGDGHLGNQNVREASRAGACFSDCFD
jgi:hypothetical protein